MSDLLIQGKATDLIWAMGDGDASNPIGLRVDCGDAGVLYFSVEQAREVIDALQRIIVGMEGK